MTKKPPPSEAVHREQPAQNQPIFDGTDSNPAIPAEKESPPPYQAHDPARQVAQEEQEEGPYDNKPMVIRTINGGITGSYDLGQSLTLQSVSGSIDVDINPRPLTKPAYLNIKTVSGSINVRFPSAEYIPVREYTSDIASTSGTIRGAFVVGKKLDFMTISGSILAQASVLEADRPAHVNTKTVSGQTDIKIVPSAPMIAAQPVKYLSGWHKSMSGSILAQYPGTWEGEMHSQSVSGSMSVDVKGDRKVSSPGGGSIMWSVGKGQGVINTKSVSGSSTIVIP